MALTAWEFIYLISKTFTIFPLKLLFNVARVSLLCLRRKLPVHSYTGIATVRTLLTTFSPREIQAVVPGTRKTVHNWAKSQPATTLLHTSVLKESDGHIHWLGIDPAHITADSKLVLFFHGGGYAVPLSTAHVNWCARHIEVSRTRGVEIGVAILEYSLCPGAHYPMQLQQAAEALQYTLGIGFRPGNIILGGDSAGGNLTFALLAHLLHPHLAIPKIELDEPLAGAFGISPWLTMRMDTLSFKENASIDMLSPSLVRQSASDFVNGEFAPRPLETGAGWCMPLDAAPEWWNGLDKCVRHVYINAGQHEMMRDHILEFAVLLREHGGSRLEVTLDKGESEAHDHILTYFMAQSRDGRSFWALMGWMLEVLK